jgi:hypothetical protein
VVALLHNPRCVRSPRWLPRSRGRGRVVAAQPRIKLLPVELKDLKGSGTSDDVTIQFKANDNDTNIKTVAWIEPHLGPSNSPQMPQLEVKFNGAESMTGINVEWKLEVKYDEDGNRPSGRSVGIDTVKIPATGFVTKPISEAWRIYQEGAYANTTFFGGEATLTCKIAGQAETTFKFRIGGKNPDDAKCKAYITQKAQQVDPLSAWFAYAIAKTESKDYNGAGTRYNQFWEGNNTGNKLAGKVIWHDDGSGPGGYGIFQVTGTYASSTADIPRDEIWNWQKNVDAALNIIESKRQDAVNWMTQQKNANNANGTALPSLTVSGVTFAEGTQRTMNDAVTIKNYNGSSRPGASFVDPDGSSPGFIIDPRASGYYCSWKNASNGWALSRYNGFNPPFNYVTRVCKEIE